MILIVNVSSSTYSFPSTQTDIFFSYFICECHRAFQVPFWGGAPSAAACVGSSRRKTGGEPAEHSCHAARRERITMSVNQRTPPASSSSSSSSGGRRNRKGRGSGGGHNNNNNNNAAAAAGGIQGYREERSPYHHHHHHVPASSSSSSIPPLQPAAPISSSSSHHHTPVTHTPPHIPATLPVHPTMSATAAAAAAAAAGGGHPQQNPTYKLPSQTVEWQKLVKHAVEIKNLHLRHLIQVCLLLSMYVCMHALYVVCMDV